MLIINATRQSILSCLPESNIVCEIGVDIGNYSEDILTNCNPKELHLIDPWLYIDDPTYEKDTVNVSNEEREERFKFVLDRFSKNISNKQVRVHRGFSYDVLPTFPDEYFDWIYVDGMHTKEAVLADLDLCYTKVKPNGFILGHDYANHELARYMNFGVIDAVSEFTRYVPGCKLLAITLEAGWPSYVICKSNGEHVDKFICNSIIKFNNPIDISDGLLKGVNFFQKWFKLDGDNKYVTCLYKR